jgi:hypothetical protein
MQAPKNLRWFRSAIAMLSGQDAMNDGKAAAVKQTSDVLAQVSWFQSVKQASSPGETQCSRREQAQQQGVWGV